MDYPANATFYVRLSLMHAHEHDRERVLELERKLVEGLPSLPGFVRGYLIVSGDPQGRVGHLNVWRSEHDADHAAQTDHVLATRAELMLLVDEDSHAEHSFVAYDPQLV
jgi:quinol monooxygenase YgiN